MPGVVLKRPDRQYALRISRQIFRLTRPVDRPGDILRYRWHVLVHPSSGDVALYIDDSRVLVHSDCDRTALSREIEADISRPNKTRLESDIDSSKGLTIRIRDVLPPDLGTFKTDQELRDDGWFQEPSA